MQPALAHTSPNETKSQNLLKHPAVNILQVVVMVFACAWFVWYCYGINLQAKWGVIDDHEIMRYFGEDGRLTLGEIPSRLLADTEIGNYGGSTRYRPSYYTLRLFETWAWGNQPFLWYLFRLYIFWLFLFIAWRVAASIIGFTPGGLIVLLTASGTYWADIFSRLGPAELYATLGLALYLLGFSLIYQYRRLTCGWLALLAGVMICAGTKENFVILILPMGFAWLDSIRRREFRPISIVAIILAGAYILWIANAVLVATGKTGADVYGNSVGFSQRLEAAYQVFLQAPLRPLKLGVIVPLILTLVFARLQPELVVPSLKLLVSSLGLILLYFSQLFFYNGEWPVGTRYDLPGMLYLPLFLVLVFWYLVQLKALIPHPVLHQLVIGAAVILLAVFVLPPAARAAGYARTKSAENVKNTAEFSNRITQIALAANAHPNYAVVVQSDYVWDYEPIYSYPFFLRAHLVHNPLFLEWRGPNLEYYVDLERPLATTLANMSISGNPPYYLSLDQLGAYAENCIVVRLHGENPSICAIAK